MKKFPLLLISFCLFSQLSFSQQIVGASFAVAPLKYNSGIVRGYLSNDGYGTDIFLKDFITPKFVMGLSSGYTKFGTKKINPEAEWWTKQEVSIIPIVALLEYRFASGKLQPYLTLQFGAGIIRSITTSKSSSWQFNMDGTIQDNGAQITSRRRTDIEVMICPELGVTYDITKRILASTAIRYSATGYGTWASVSAGFAYRFIRSATS